ncbi:MAG TPA: site-2 protease family protein [Cytophagales bacterium]|nr:site-2 protease family protein [Cytophagales bacterium]HAA20851.1 site-2 protease family protein [Cytophagales bacterium]HAP59139.1 site-2 protease family protein [Cytophagales bacterium]
MTKITPKVLARHLLLFIATFFTVTLTGALVYAPGPMPEPVEDTFAWYWAFFSQGFYFSIPFLGILLAHEMGHYVVSRLRKVDTSLPYFLPFVPAILGTLGAVIVMRGQRNTRKDYFDIGIAGPLAGWVLAIGVMWYGYATLPPAEHIFEIHPEYEAYGTDYADYVFDPEVMLADTALADSLVGQIYFGTNLTMKFFEAVVADPERIPPQREIMHFPFIMAGFWALFFTALNLLPIGQLDGGHILYGLVGAKRQRIVSATIFLGFIMYAGLGLINPYSPPMVLAWQLPGYGFFLFFIFRGLEQSIPTRIMTALAVLTFQFGFAFFFPEVTGFNGWLVFAFLLGRVVGVYHPVAPIDVPLDRNRQILGWIALIIFILSFSPEPAWMP